MSTPLTPEQMSTGYQDAKPRRKATSYEVSWSSERDRLTWYVVPGLTEASSAREAIRQWVESYDGEQPLEGKHVRAIPVRHITDVTVSFHTQTRLELS
jgi:hypothetical protein